MSAEYHPYFPEGFFVRDRDTVQAKVGAIAFAGAKKLHIVADFDRTLTTNGPKDLTSWDILTNLLPPAAQAREERRYEYYRPLERNHTLTMRQARHWWSATLSEYAKAGRPTPENPNNPGINIAQIRDAAGTIALRPGVGELFELAKAADVHTTIMSAGIKDVIDVVADHHNINPDLVLSTELKTDEAGKITGWKPETVIHLLNKGEKGSPQLAEIREQRPNAIIVGDAIEDTSMVSGDEGVLRIRLGDPHKIDPRNIGDYMEESFMAGYDMIRLGDFTPITEMASWIIDHSGLAYPE
jgi:HAD superfamily phosphoserine phosphatase-like hydrolase